MAWSLVQGFVTAAYTAATASPLTAPALTNTPTVGNLMVAIVSWSGGSATFAVSDNTPNSYTATTNTPSKPGSDGVGVWYWVATGTPGKTVKFTYGGTVFADIWVAEFSGNLTPIGSVFDKDAVATNASETNVILPSLTPAGANELMVGVLTTAGGTTSANSPWTPVEGSIGANGDFAEYYFNPGSGAQAIAFTTTAGANQAMSAAFKPKVSVNPKYRRLDTRLRR